MCGFAGVTSARPLTGEELGRLAAATRLLRHRGPDDEGYVLLGPDGARQFHGDDSISEMREFPHFSSAAAAGANVALSSRRLSIIDLTAAGHMPMRDPDTGNWVVYNGELYNYKELREELAGLGHHFRSTSDTEVLLKAYAQWGTACLDRLNGMWAFAIWDAHRRELFCARDRFGEKQLYFRCLPGGLWFASEVRPLLLVGACDGIEEPLVWDFLMYGLADHVRETFFRGISQLLPGEYLQARPGAEPEIRQYYVLAASENRRMTLDEAGNHLRGLLRDSVCLRLRSDVPVGSFFSGGVDSSSIVVLANEVLRASANGHSRLRTYTNVYGDGHPYDESDRIRPLIPKLTHVDSVFVPASSEAFQRDLLEMVECQEQPFHNASIFASFHLLRLIRERDGIKVMLTGEAGDELLAGYFRVYLPLLMLGFLRGGRVPTWWREVRAWGASYAFKATLKGMYRTLPAALRMRLQRAANPVAKLMKQEFSQAFQHRECLWNEQWRNIPLEDRLRADIMRFNLPQLLRHLDRNAMHSSIETRVPFLDYRVVEFALALPIEYRLQGGYTKFVLRRAMADVLPPEIAWNRVKLGFGMAEQFWFRDSIALLDDVDELRRFVDVNRVRKSIESAPEQAYWLPVCLGLWLRVFGKGGAVAAA